MLDSESNLRHVSMLDFYRNGGRTPKPRAELQVGASHMVIHRFRGARWLEGGPDPSIRIVVAGAYRLTVGPLVAHVGRETVVVSTSPDPIRVSSIGSGPCTLAIVRTAGQLLRQARADEDVSLFGDTAWFDLVLRRGMPAWCLAIGLAVRVAATSGKSLEDSGAVARMLRAIGALQADLSPAVARCPGRSWAHKLDVFSRLQRVRSLFDLDFTGALSLDQMARLANFSRQHFLRTFQRAFGYTPFQCFDEARVRRARTFLAEPSRSVEEIGRALGFNNRSAFSRWVSVRLGDAPSRLRGDSQHGRPHRHESSTSATHEENICDPARRTDF